MLHRLEPRPRSPPHKIREITPSRVRQTLVRREVYDSPHSLPAQPFHHDLAAGLLLALLKRSDEIEAGVVDEIELVEMHMELGAGRNAHRLSMRRSARQTPTYAFRFRLACSRSVPLSAGMFQRISDVWCWTGIADGGGAVTAATFARIRGHATPLQAI